MRKAQEWNQSCPNTQCEYYSQVNSGNIVSVSTYESKSGKRRDFSCKHCGEMFSKTRGTVFFNLKTSEDNMSLREEVSEIQRPFEQRWMPRTPAMAVGLTDHVWSFRDLLTAKLPKDT